MWRFSEYTWRQNEINRLDIEEQERINQIQEEMLEQQGTMIEQIEGIQEEQGKSLDSIEDLVLELGQAIGNSGTGIKGSINYINKVSLVNHEGRINNIITRLNNAGI